MYLNDTKISKIKTEIKWIKNYIGVFIKKKKNLIHDKNPKIKTNSKIMEKKRRLLYLTKIKIKPLKYLSIYLSIYLSQSQVKSSQSQLYCQFCHMYRTYIQRIEIALLSIYLSIYLSIIYLITFKVIKEMLTEICYKKMLTEMKHLFSFNLKCNLIQVLFFIKLKVK